MAQKVRDWKALTAAHKHRGVMLTVVFDPKGAAFTQPAYNQKTGTPRIYSDDLIEALLTVKLMTGLSLRAAEGFALGMRELAEGTWPVPNYSTLSRREAGLVVDLGAKSKPDGKRILMVDSTGLKVFGEGEWKMRQHGVDKRRTWRKVHILVDRETGHIIAVETTLNDVADCTVLPALLPEDLTNTFVLGDGAYHTGPLHRTVFRKGGTLLSPPPCNARPWKPHHWVKDEAAFRFRNSQLTQAKLLGRKGWRMASGCSRRSYVESVMHRLKSITGASLSARTLDRQKVEVMLRCKALNATATSTWTPAV